MAGLTLTTPEDILTLALADANIIGQGATASSWDMNNAFIRLNLMLTEWKNKRWLVYHNILGSKVSDGRTTAYTVGPSGDINLSYRPDKLEAAFFRQIIPTAAPNQFDTPLDILQSYEDWAQITMKQLTSFPNCCFLDSAWPLANLYVWPWPQATIYEIFIVLKDTAALNAFTSLSQTIALPDPYFSALHLNMVQRLRAVYQLEPNPTIDGLVRNVNQTLRGSNAQIARLYMPRELVRRGVYNPYSDQVQ